MSPAFTGTNLSLQPTRWGKFAGLTMLVLTGGYFVVALAMLYYVQPAMAATNYNPDAELMTGSVSNITTNVGGNVANLSANDSVYHNLRGYPTAYNGGQWTANAANTNVNASTTWTNVVNLNFTSPNSSVFFVIASAEIARSSTTAARPAALGLSLDGGSSRAGAEGYGSFSTVACATSWPSVTIPYLDNHSGSAIDGSGNVTLGYRLMLKCASTSGNAYSRYPRLTAWAVGGRQNVDYAYTSNAASTTTNAGATPAVVQTLTFTPNVTQDWLIFAYAEMRSTVTTANNWFYLDVDGTNQSTEITRNLVNTVDVGDVPAFAMDKVSLSGGSSHSIYVKMGTSSGTLNYRKVRIIAIPATKFQDVGYGEADSVTNTNGTGLVNVLNVSYQPTVTGDTIVIARGGQYAGATANAVNVTLCNANTAFGMASRFTPSAVDTTNIAPMIPFGMSHIVASVSNGSATTFRIRFNGSVASATAVKVQNVKMLVLPVAPAGQYTMDVELKGNSSTTALTSLKWQVDSSWKVPSVYTTLQLYNYNSSSYPTSGDGFLNYTSSATANTDENSNQTITTNPEYYRKAGASEFSVKVVGVVNSTTTIEWNGDWVSYEETYPYTPAITNIQWYDNEVANDPSNTTGKDTEAGDAMAREGESPDSVRIVYNGNKIKFRAAINATTSTSGTDVKFRLQYSDDLGFVNVANVGESGSGTIWRYADGGGSDNDVVTNLRLSQSTVAGRRNESGTSSSNFDPSGTGTVTEFEFCLQNNGATAGSPYWFRLFYNENSGGTGTPSGVVGFDGISIVIMLRAATAYDLEVNTAPTDVVYGSTNNDTYQYIFASDTEIIGFWDKRSSGTYSVTADGTDMTGAGTILDDDIAWTSSTSVLTGAFASDKSGMSTVGGNFGATVTAYDANPATEGKGGFVFYPTIDLTNLNGKATGNYAGTIVITIV